MSASQPRLRSLLRQAEKLAGSGKRAAAEKLYRQITEEAPESVEAWLGLANTTADNRLKHEALQQVQSIDPARDISAGNSSPKRAVEVSQSAETDVEGVGTGDPFEQSREWLEQATSNRDDEAGVATDEAADVVPAAQDTHDPSSIDMPDESYDLVCYRHPGRETSLRCYTCNRPICSECAVKTPVGYRCPTCIRETEDQFFNARVADYILAPLVSLPLSVVAGYLVVIYGRGFGIFFIFILLFAGGAVGGLIGRAAKRVVGRRRGRYLPHLVAATVILGVVIPALPILVFILMGNPGLLGSLLMPGIYLFVATGAAYHQMK
jgi:hypothetical protein